MSEDIRVLIVEDNKNARATIKNSLSGLNCNFSEAESGEKALSIIKKKTFDIIIMDIGLPGIDGIETYRRAKEMTPDLAPVIILTGYLDSGRQKKGKEMGIYEFLTKDPLPHRKLKECVLQATKPGA